MKQGAKEQGTRSSRQDTRSKLSGNSNISNSKSKVTQVGPTDKQQNNHTTSARMSSQNVHLSTAQSIQRVSRDRGGKHRPAATSFHNREFSKGTTQQVDKNGLRMNGMWDPTFAPSLRRLSQLGFSPKKQ